MTRTEAIRTLQNILEEATEEEDSVFYVISEDAEALKIAINSLKVDEMHQLEKEDADEFIPKRTGHWIVGSDTDIKGETVYWFTCSNCNCDRGQHTNYCPDCGAKMENTCEEVNDGTEN